MDVTRAMTPGAARQTAGDVLVDGLLTGMLGALAVAAWFLVLDTLRGHPLQTPALLGSVLLRGGLAGYRAGSIVPLDVAAYTAFHFVAFTVVGLSLSLLMTLFERFPIMFFVIALLFAFLEVGFAVLSAVLHLEAPDRLPGWSVMMANLLASAAMAWYQVVRHPRAIQGVESLWQQPE